MIKETRKKTINGREVEYLDVIIHSVKTKFGLWDRIKILLGKEVRTHSEIYTQHEHCKIVGSEAKTSVARLFPKKSQGMIHQISDKNETEKINNN